MCTRVTRCPASCCTEQHFHTLSRIPNIEITSRIFIWFQIVRNRNTWMCSFPRLAHELIMFLLYLIALHQKAAAWLIQMQHSQASLESLAVIQWLRREQGRRSTRGCDSCQSNCADSGPVKSSNTSQLTQVFMSRKAESKCFLFGETLYQSFRLPLSTGNMSHIVPHKRTTRHTFGLFLHLVPLICTGVLLSIL